MIFCAYIAAKEIVGIVRELLLAATRESVIDETSHRLWDHQRMWQKI